MRSSKGKCVPVRSMQEEKAQHLLNLALLEASAELHAPAALPPGKISNFLRIREIRCKNLRRALSVESCTLSKLNVNNNMLTYTIYSENYPDEIILGKESGESF